MKAFSIAVGLVAAACVCAGMMLDTNEYVTETYEARVSAGEGLDDVAARYYKKDDRKIVWDEFRTEVWSKNKNRLHNGSPWVGDVVIVEVKKKVEKN